MKEKKRKVKSRKRKDEREMMKEKVERGK